MTLAWAIHQAARLGLADAGGHARPCSSSPGWPSPGPATARQGFTGLPANRTLVALGWLVLAVAPLLVGISYARLHRSAQDLGAGECVAAKREALSSLSLSAKRPAAVRDHRRVRPGAGLRPGRRARDGRGDHAGAPELGRALSGWRSPRPAAGIDPRAAIDRAIALNPLEPGLRNAAMRLSSSNPRAWELAAPRLRRQALSSGKFSITNL